MLKYKLIFKENENYVSASWGPIVELFRCEDEQIARSAHHLSEKHIDPDSFERMNVGLAAAVFSAKTASALKAGFKLGELTHEDCSATAEFISRVNTLFDCLNSKNICDSNPYKRPLSEKNPQVENFLKDSLPWILQWQSDGTINDEPPCFNGFYLSVNSILLQWEEIKTANPTFYLLTSRLNQENLFSYLRAIGGFNDTPTAQQIRRNLQYSILTNLEKSSDKTNCEPD